MHLDRTWRFVFNSGKEEPVELPYFIVFGQITGQLEKGDTEQLCSLWEVEWAQTRVSPDSTSIPASAVAAAVLCLCVSLQHLTIMFSFISRILLLPGPQSLSLCPSVSLSLVPILSLMCCLSLTLSANPLGFSFESCKVISLSEFSLGNEVLCL